MNIRHILVPTDFSTCGKKGSDYAQILAPALEAEVHLLNRVFIHPLWHTLTEEEKERYPESGFWENVALREFAKLTQEFEKKNIPVSTTYGPGDIVPLVLDVIEEQEIDLLVMGTHGLGGINEWLYGSNAQKIIRRAPCPSIAIKKLPEEINFSRIVFATDYKALSEKAFTFIDQWASYFEGEIHMVHVNLFLKGEVEEEEIERVDSWLAKARSSKIVRHEVRDISAEAGIREAAERLGADLVALANYPEHSFQRILVGSVSEALVNHLDIPVMVVPV